MQRRASLGLLLTLLVTLPPAVVTPQSREISRGGRVDADVDVEVYNLAGTVRVRGWDRDEVQVEGTLGAGVELLEFENDVDDVEIRVRVPRRARRDPAAVVGESHLDIMVPHGASLSVETLGARITVEGVDGSVSLESSGGVISYSGAAREVEATSAGGGIDVVSTADRVNVDVEGVAGEVVVEFVGGELDISTVTGSLRVIGGRIDVGRFESVSGSLYFEGDIGAGADLDFENFNGDIELLLPEETAASFDISTYSGSIETEFGFAARAAQQYSPAREAAFTLGDGGDAEVVIETFSGSVRVRRR